MIDSLFNILFSVSLGYLALIVFAYLFRSVIGILSLIEF